jgi:ribosomal protein S18 acetylase RimI-like enzyme
MGLNSADTPDQIRRFLERNPGLSTVAESEGRLVGTALCGHDGRRGFIYHLAVDQNARARGVGRRLVEQSLTNLKEAGLTRCHIVVYAHNTAGQKFWEHIGFTARKELLICSSLLD